jgi:hypothetical protein
MLSGHARCTKKRSRPSAKQPPAATRSPSPTGIWGLTYLEALVVVAVAAESCFNVLTEAGQVWGVSYWRWLSEPEFCAAGPWPDGLARGKGRATAGLQ